MRLISEGKEYLIKRFKDGSLEGYQDNILIPPSLVVKLLAQLPEKIQALICKGLSDEEITKQLLSSLNQRTSFENRKFLFLQLPEDCLNLTLVSKLTTISMYTLKSRIERDKIKTYKLGPFRIVKREEVAKLFQQAKPLFDEKWRPIQEIIKRFNINPSTMHKWIEELKQQGEDIRQVPEKGSRRIYLSPTAFQKIMKKVNLRLSDQERFVSEGNKYVWVSQAVSEILQQRGICPKKSTIHRKYYRRLARIIEKHPSRGAKKDGRLYILESVLNWRKKHPMIQELSKIFNLSPKEIWRICTLNNISTDREKGPIPKRRINQAEFEQALQASAAKST